MHARVHSEGAVTVHPLDHPEARPDGFPRSGEGEHVSVAERLDHITVLTELAGDGRGEMLDCGEGHSVPTGLGVGSEVLEVAKRKCHIDGARQHTGNGVPLASRTAACAVSSSIRRR